MQSLTSSLPVTSMYLPPPQSMQSAAAIAAAAEYFPTTQLMHEASAGLPLAEYRPTPQSMQSVAMVLPLSTPYFPAGHAVHDFTPDMSLYLPF
jgi:hypothetical protein